MAGIPDFTRLEGETLYFDKKDHELRMYVPEEYNNGRLYIQIGSLISLFGVVNYSIFDKSGKNIGLKTLKLPTQFLTEPSEIQKLKQVSLIKNQPVDDYRVLIYRPGDRLIVQNPVKDVVNAENLFRLFFTTAKFPTTLDYRTLQEFFTINAELNGFSYGITDQLFGVIISEICRNPADESVPFRLSKINDMHNYKPISLNMVPKYVSPFAAITSENWDLAVVNSALTEPGKVSPLEKILMG